MNEQELRKLCEDTIKEEIIKNIDSALIFTYIKDLEEKIKMKDKIINKMAEDIRLVIGDDNYMEMTVEETIEKYSEKVSEK